MKLMTRSDFDGLASAVLLLEVGVIDCWEFVHPKDLQDGKVEVDENVVLANVPYVPGCGMWFDHHASEAERKAYKDFKGRCEQAPSCARIIYEYYGGSERFPENLTDLVVGADKVDSGNLSNDDIINPVDWVLLGFIMDPRTGLGRFHDFRISNYALMSELIRICHTMTIDEILDIPDVKERVELYLLQSKKFDKMLKEHSRVVDEILITDLRGVETIYTGNRFYIYALYPHVNISVWIVNGKGGKGCSAAVGHSVLNRTSKVDVGSLMLKYGGGGHPRVGTCQFSDEEMDSKLDTLLKEIVEMNR